MKKVLFVFISLLFAAQAFAEPHTCYKVAQGQITEWKDFVEYNYVCIERLENDRVAVSVYDGHKVDGKTLPELEFYPCVETRTTLTSFHYVPRNYAIKIYKPIKLVAPKMILCSEGFMIAYEEPTETNLLTSFIMDGNLYTIAATNFTFPLVHREIPEAIPYPTPAPATTK